MKHSRPWRHAASYSAVFAITALFASPTFAAPQEPPAPPPAEEADTSAGSTLDGEPAATVRDEIIVSAQADEAPRRRVGSSVTVLDRAEIEARRAVSVAELLRTVPGVEVARTGPPGGNTSVFLRGGNSSHTLVLVDGVRVNSPAVGAFDFAGLSTDNVERIEVVRGPQSALYGSEAMGGVISIHTRRGSAGRQAVGATLARNFDGSVSAEVGSESSQRFATAWRGVARLGNGDSTGGLAAGDPGVVDWSLAASHRQFDGVSSASEENGNDEADRFHSTTASGLVGFGFAGDGRAEVSLRYLDSDTGLDGFAFGVGPVDDPNYDLTREALYANLRLEKPVTDRWTQHLRIGTAREDLAATDPDTPFQSFATDTVVTDAVLRSDLALLSGTDTGGATTSDTLSLGVGWEERKGESPGAFDETVDVTSAFAENRFAWRDRLFLTTGARYDDHSAFGSETTWRGTASWLASDGARLHGSYGTGFKAPTFNELYFPFFGNPDLEAETSEGYDVGLELGGTDLDGWAADITWFANDTDNLIDFDVSTFLANNIRAARVRGVESWLALPRAGEVATRLSYTWTDSEDRDSGRPLARRPDHRASLTALWQPREGRSRWDGSLSLIAVADRIDSDGSDMEDYQRLDLTAGYRVMEELGVYLRLENALDDDSAEINGYTTPGAVVSVGLRYGV